MAIPKRARGTGVSETIDANKLKKTGALAKKAVSAKTSSGDSDGELKLVNTLARGLSVLETFRSGDRSLGNAEIANRTGLPKPTVSRLTKTLTQLGYLNHNFVLGNYELGHRALALGYVALSNTDVRRLARPYMQDLAEATSLNVGLGVRDKLMMLHVEACDGHALVGLRLYPGSRMPIANTAMGRAYLAVASEGERESILDGVRSQYGDDWTTIRKDIERSMRDIEEKGFCTSIGDWRKDINGVGAALAMPDGRGVYAFNVGGPAYLAPAATMEEEFGPMLARVTEKILTDLGVQG